VEVARTRRERVRGLRRRRVLARDGGMLFPRCRSVHTRGMAFGITMVFLDADLRVVDVVGAEPGRLLVPRRCARHVLELPAGVDLRAGDRLVATSPVTRRQAPRAGR
jgi:uncharacterized membrane protein (UPF0127 family)